MQKCYAHPKKWQKKYKNNVRTYIFLLVLSSAILPSSALASYFEESVKSLVLEKIGNYHSVDLRFESENKLQQIIVQDNEITGVVLTFFSLETKSFKAVAKLESNELEIFGKFDNYFEILVASKLLRRGVQINQEDVKSIRVKKVKNISDIIKDPSLIYGMESKINIMPGQIIKLSDLKKTPIVKENDPITLLYESSGISLKTLGISLSSGAIGDKIRAKNEKTNVVVFGEIINKNVIRVGTQND